MRHRVLPRLAGALILLATAGCSADDEAASEAAFRVERCTERFLQRVNLEDSPNATRAELERYVEVTYCSRFESRGWV